MADTSALVNAIKTASKSGVKVEKTEDPAPSKKLKNGHLAIPMNFKPCLYLNDKDLSSINNWKAGQKVYIAVECTVKSVNSNESMDGKTAKKQYSADVQIDAFVDMTGSK